MNLMIRNDFMIPALVFHGIFVASQSLRLKNIWQQEELCSSSFCPDIYRDIPL